jgi:hypothetical protein
VKKIAILCIAALLLTGVVVMTTRVLSSDAATLSNEEFYPGTLALRVSGADGRTTGDTTAVFGGSGLVPGSFIGPATFSLTSSGSEAGDHVDIAFQTTFSNNPAYDSAALGPDIVDMNTQIVVTQLTYGTVSLLDKTGGVFATPDIRQADADGDGVLTMAELSGTVLRGLAVPDCGGVPQKFTIAATIPESTGNGIQGDWASTAIRFGLFQDAAQHLVVQD